MIFLNSALGQKYINSCKPVEAKVAQEWPQSSKVPSQKDKWPEGAVLCPDTQQLLSGPWKTTEVEDGLQTWQPHLPRDSHDGHRADPGMPSLNL